MKVKDKTILVTEDSNDVGCKLVVNLLVKRNQNNSSRDKRISITRNDKIS
ncbi:hypothetical protein [Bacteroides graminisolvens]|nr:hypothetical protein [Bacteroides graminisolvens]